MTAKSLARSNRPWKIGGLLVLAILTVAGSFAAAEQLGSTASGTVEPQATSSPAPEKAAVLVDQGFTLVHDTRLTYAFLVRPAAAGMALDGATYRVSFHDNAGKNRVRS